MTAKSKQWQIAKVEQALAALTRCIEHMEELIGSYPESEGPYSGCHPRSAYQSMVKTMKEQAKTLARGRV